MGQARYETRKWMSWRLVKLINGTNVKVVSIRQHIQKTVYKDSNLFQYKSKPNDSESFGSMEMEMSLQ